MTQLVCLMLGTKAACAALFHRARGIRGNTFSLKDKRFKSRYYYAYGLYALQRPYSFFVLCGQERATGWFPRGQNLLAHLNRAGNTSFWTGSGHNSVSSVRPSFARGCNIAMEPEDATPINVVSVVQSTPSVAAETVQQLVDAAKEEAAKLRSSTEDACIDMPSPDKLKALMKEINATDSEQSTDEA